MRRDLIDGYKIEETLRLPSRPSDTGSSPCRAERERPRYPAAAIGRAPLTFQPYYRAGGRRDRAWRLTWMIAGAGMTRNDPRLPLLMTRVARVRRGPLSGVRVLDLSAYIAGPYGCTLLADQGADVIKVEPPDGDNLRQYPSTLQSENRAFLGVNRSKQGVVLDLKTSGRACGAVESGARRGRPGAQLQARRGRAAGRSTMRG